MVGELRDVDIQTEPFSHARPMLQARTRIQAERLDNDPIAQSIIFRVVTTSKSLSAVSLDEYSSKPPAGRRSGWE
ncbi:hypothetical protein A8144_07325 [Mycobacterium leprae 3125609]|nr:hypothetical protein A8144_07325 [Mycobacterium leprae 3125609]